MKTCGYLPFGVKFVGGTVKLIGGRCVAVVRTSSTLPSMMKCMCSHKPHCTSHNPVGWGMIGEEAEHVHADVERLNMCKKIGAPASGSSA